MSAAWPGVGVPLVAMMGSDPILNAHCPHLLPTAEEVAETWSLLSARPASCERFKQTVRIAGDSRPDSREVRPVTGFVPH